MTLSTSSQFQSDLQETFGARIDKINEQGGGSFGRTFRFEMNNKAYFMKVQTGLSGTKMLEAEYGGLSLIEKTKTLDVPDSRTLISRDSYTALVMRYYAPGSKIKPFWVDLGQRLSKMHRVSHAKYGWSTDNFIGSLPQANNYHSNWTSFYREERLIPQFQMAFEQGLIQSSELRRSENLCASLDSLIYNEDPSLCHGDLWNGNVLCTTLGKAVLIDPCIYFGHREVDIAMSLLFGGFDSAFYEAYQDCFPLHVGWSERIPYYQLYYLLVHLNLFGHSYKSSVLNIIDSF